MNPHPGHLLPEVGSREAIGSRPAAEATFVFETSEPLTLGVEIEAQLIDPKTLDLAPRASELLEACTGMDRVELEFFRSTLEVKTGICRTVHDAAATLVPDLRRLTQEAAALEIGLSTTGCHPFAKYADCRFTETARYRELMDSYQWLTRRMTVYGLHFHLGMRSGDDCIRFLNRLLPYVPHLLALSASSPFWQGQDTGLVACRPTTYEALPTAGLPYPVHDWEEFEILCQKLRRSGAIQSMKDLWWDIRPSPGFGTLELRCCDGPATLAEALALAAFTHLLGRDISRKLVPDECVPPPPRWILRENKWRAIRHGLDASIIVTDDGDTSPLSDEIDSLLDVLAADAAEMGYEAHIETLREIIARGNSSSRQRSVYEKRGSIEDVVKFNVGEFCAGRPIW